MFQLKYLTSLTKFGLELVFIPVQIAQVLSTSSELTVRVYFSPTDQFAGK